VVAAGDRIAFGIGGFFQNSTTTADIAVLRPDGTGVQILTDGMGNYGLPSWSPDGRRLVYRAVGSHGKGLRIVDLETRVVRVLTTGSGHENFPSWSPKGDRIAFTSDRDGNYEIYTIRPDGTDVQRLTRTPGNDAHNAWSPDGQWIAFTSARGGFKDEAPLHPYNPQPYGDLYVMRADGSDVRMLTDDQFEEGTPSWLPTPRTR
jgi:Tol biopolymer transport system component